ncbi:hypothetical protein [Nocardia abscessus]|uniref:hypothetical protein n=1 Tax=Nocardia abscessus TaxID=120957 RepID=UPI002456CAB6|nr:hypothetical protein [Nocardia abscessus]
MTPTHRASNSAATSGAGNSTSTLAAALSGSMVKFTDAAASADDIRAEPVAEDTPWVWPGEKGEL